MTYETKPFNSPNSPESYIWIKFFSEKEFSPLMLESSTISIGSLKTKIIAHFKHMYRSKCEQFDKMATKQKERLEFDLNIFDADTKEMFTDDNYIIDAYRRVLLERVPKTNTKTVDRSARETKNHRRFTTPNRDGRYHHRLANVYLPDRYEKRRPTPSKAFKLINGNPIDSSVKLPSTTKLDGLYMHIPCKSKPEMDVYASQLNPCVDIVDSNKFQFTKPNFQSLSGNMPPRGRVITSKPAFRERSRSKSKELHREY